MKNKSILFLTFLITPLIHHAQSLTPFVVSAAGGCYSNASAQLSFTTGEMTMVNTLAFGNFILTQGFQQPFDFSVFISENENIDFEFNVFPNPNHGSFSFYINSKTSAALKLTIYDAIGKAILRKKFDVDSGAQYYQLQLSEASEGIYFLELLTDQNKLTKKIQIIH